MRHLEYCAWISLTLYALCSTGRGHAQSATLDEALSIEPGARCLEKARLVDQIAAWLGTSHVTPDLSVLVYWDPQNRRSLAFEIVRGDQRRRRVFDPTPKRCDDVHAVASLAIAIALDNERLQKWLQDTLPAPAAQSVVVPSPTVAAPRQPARQSRTDPGGVRLVAFQVSAAREVLPNTSFGGQLGLEFAFLDWLGGRVDVLAQAAWANQIEGTRGQFDVVGIAGSLQACTGGWLTSDLRIALCAGAAAGGQRAAGYGYGRDTSDVGPWIGTRAGLRIELRLGIPWVIDLDVISAIISPRFEVEREDGAIADRSLESVGFMLSAGPGINFFHRDTVSAKDLHRRVINF